jgi:hypothetical protein
VGDRLRPHLPQGQVGSVSLRSGRRPKLGLSLAARESGGSPSFAASGTELCAATVARSAERCLCRLSASLRIRARSASAAVLFTSVASISTRDADSETGKVTEKATIEGYVRAVAGCFADVRFPDAREGPSIPVPATVCSRGRAMRHLGNRHSGDSREPGVGGVLLLRGRCLASRPERGSDGRPTRRGKRLAKQILL